jgi:hypothetical protein
MKSLGIIRKFNLLIDLKKPFDSVDREILFDLKNEVVKVRKKS